MLSLIDLKRYLQAKQSVSLFELVSHFNTDSDTISVMLQYFLDKNHIKLYRAEPACGKVCVQCEFVGPAVYQWVSDPPS